MSSLTFATSSNKEDIFGSFKVPTTIEENKSAGRVLEAPTQPKLVSLNSNKSNGNAQDNGIALFGLGQ